MEAVLEAGCFAFSAEEEAALRFLGLACRDGWGEALGVSLSDPVFEKLSFAGTVLRLREGRAELQIDVRFPPSADMEEWTGLLKEKAAGFGMEAEEISRTNGYERNLEDPVIKILLEACRETCLPDQKPYVMGGNTYARFFEKGVGFGPGIPADCSGLKLPEGHGGGHGCDEVQPISSLLTAVEVYVKALIKLDELLGG